MKKPNGLSRLEHALTYHLRLWLGQTFTGNQIRYLSFILSLATCLVDANVAVFSLFTGSFIGKLGYDKVAINIIAGSMLTGLYLTLPLLGYLSDEHGPVLLALIGLTLTPGYLLARVVYERRLNEWLMAACFFFVGMGTSSSYFCSLLTCARVFPNHKGLSISMPVACYGLSAFLLSWVFTWDGFVVEKSGDLDVGRVFGFFSGLYLLVCLVNWVGSIVVSIEKEVLFAEMYQQEEHHDGPEPYRRGCYGGVDGHRSEESEVALFDAGVVDNRRHQEKFRLFLRDPSMKLVMVALFLLAGPLEVFISNLGSIVAALAGADGAADETDISRQVSIFSISSTITRLSVGVLSDLFNGAGSHDGDGDDGQNGAKSCGGSVVLVEVASFLTVLGFGLLSVGWNHMDVISVVVGIGYGTVFTVFPTLVATVWGVEIFGSTWGLFLAAPAIGAIVFGMLYALEVPIGLFACVAVGAGGCVGTAWRKYWSTS